MVDGVSVIVPTADRLVYLPGALRDLAAQRFPTEDFEIVVVDDGRRASCERLVREISAESKATIRYVRRRGRVGLNAARNLGIRETERPLVAFVDDDCRFGPDWLPELAQGVDACPRADAFGGPIRVSLPPKHPRWCGREPFPISSLDRGSLDRFVDVVYGANMAVRRSAFDRIGLFDELHPLYGDELEWLLRLRRSGGLVRYIASAGVEHTRFAHDVTFGRLLRDARLKAKATAALDREQGIGPRRGDVVRRGVRMSTHAVRRGCWSALAHAVEAFAYLYYSSNGRRDRP